MIRTIQLQVALVLLFSAARADGFHMPSPFLAKHAVVSVLSEPTYQFFDQGNPMTTGEGEARWVSIPIGSTDNNFWISDGGALDTVRSIAIGLTAILFLLAGATYLYASFIIPMAAQELEKECKELDPQLWDQYQAKLGKGETIASRPDLMQELGSKLQPLLDAKIAAMNKEGDGKIPTALGTTMNPMRKTAANIESKVPIVPISSGNQWDNDDDAIIDAVIEKKTSD